MLPKTIWIIYSFIIALTAVSQTTMAGAICCQWACSQGPNYEKCFENCVKHGGLDCGYEPRLPREVAPPCTRPSCKAAPDRFSPCDGLTGSRFVSLTEYEVGLTPTGPAYDHWEVLFSDKEMTYLHSDIAETDSFQCNGPEGAIKTILRGGFGYYSAPYGRAAAMSKYGLRSEFFNFPKSSITFSP